MEPITSIRGRCLCGTVQFAITPPTNWCAHCHCEYCRRAHSAAFVTWVGVPAGQFEVAAGEAAMRRFASSSEATRTFCGECGSMLLFEGARWPDEVHVAVGSLTDPLDRAPAGHAYYDQRVAWGIPGDDLARYGGESGTEPL